MWGDREGGDHVVVTRWLRGGWRCQSEAADGVNVSSNEAVGGRRSRVQEEEQ